MWHTTGAEGFVSSGLSSAEEERSQGGAFVPKSHSSSRRLSTKSRTSRKSAISDDARSDAAASPPAGWATSHAPAENIAAAAATAATAATGDDDIFLPELPEMGGKDAQPPTPPHPNMDVFSREHSSMIAVAEPVGAALTPVGASGQITPDVMHSPTGACKAPAPMKPNLDVSSRERSPCVPASPHKAPPLPPPQDET
ncbi:mucin-7-like [Rhipicephalus sanguineus]|uniref:mucin-7-like n=1 Tax=Rhipicephalus sanguineus TaxID=34632 RepID=UPI001895BBEC|nr:mucin-7-like [Rhipicephalus sanguineus]